MAPTELRIQDTRISKESFYKSGWGSYCGVLIVRILVYWGLDSVPLIFENSHTCESWIELQFPRSIEGPVV